jgi:hypothetical protein
MLKWPLKEYDEGCGFLRVGMENSDGPLRTLKEHWGFVVAEQMSHPAPRC